MRGRVRRWKSKLGKRAKGKKREIEKREKGWK